MSRVYIEKLFPFCGKGASSLGDVVVSLTRSLSIGGKVVMNPVKPFFTIHWPLSK